jgi:hypothetical protein
MMMCPLCNERPVVVITCPVCWVDVSKRGRFTEEQRAKIALFERHAPMTIGHRELFNGIKSRPGMGGE